MRLIIDVNDNEYIGIKEYPNNITSYPVTIHVYDAIRKGIPFDDVKAEIKTFTITEKSEYDTGFNDAVLKCFNALDNIGKAESEVNE